MSMMPLALYYKLGVLCREKKGRVPFCLVKKVLSKNFHAILHNGMSEMCSILVGKTLNCQTKRCWLKPQICPFYDLQIYHFYDLRTTFSPLAGKKVFFPFLRWTPGVPQSTPPPFRPRGAPVNPPPPPFRPPLSPHSNTSLPPPPLSFMKGVHHKAQNKAHATLFSPVSLYLISPSFPA